MKSINIFSFPFHHTVNTTRYRVYNNVCLWKYWKAGNKKIIQLQNAKQQTSTSLYKRRVKEARDVNVWDARLSAHLEVGMARAEVRARDRVPQNDRPDVQKHPKIVFLVFLFFYLNGRPFSFDLFLFWKSRSILNKNVWGLCDPRLGFLKMFLIFAPTSI